jgi:Ca2+-binding EF-hand superfamily protein
MNSSIEIPKLYPIINLTDKKLDQLIKLIKKNLYHFNMKLQDFFKVLDSNNDGFVTINEFSKGLDKFITLSMSAKEGLFNYLDNLNIGMFDYE